MKIIFTITLYLSIVISVFAQGKVEIIYNNGLTHTNVKADIFQSDTTYLYTVTDAKMWTGETSTKIIYKGNYDKFLSFLRTAVAFAEENRKNIGAQTEIDGIPVKITKKVGIRCVTFGSNGEIKNTNENSLKGAIEALEKWKEL